MQKEMISSKQAICIITLFIFGSSVIFDGDSGAGQDSWISILVAGILAVPVVIMYARICALFPEQDIFDVLQTLFGNILGKFFIILITWYALDLGSLVLRNFADFTVITSLPETPQLPLMIIMMAVTTYIAITGVETFGKLALIFFPLIIIVVLFTLIMSAKFVNFQNFLPIMEHSPDTILYGASKIFAFPFAETVLFLSLGYSLKKGTNPYSVYLYSLFFGIIILLVIFARNLTVMGLPMMRISYFPSYMEAQMISIGNFLERVEGSISYNFMLGGIIKITLCLIAAAKGFAKLFGTDNYRYILIPTSLLMMALATTLYDSIIQSIDFINVYFIYAFPFQVIIPFIIWGWAEIKTRMQKRKAAQPNMPAEN